VDVVVIGGGAIGLASAWSLSRAGHTVTVCDPEPARGATRASAGMIAPVSETHFGEEALQRLNLAGADRWPGFAADLEEATGAASGYRRTGSIAVAFDADDKRALDRLHAHQTELGLPVELLSPAACRERAPLLSSRLRGGLWIEGDHQADNRRMAQTLLTGLDRSGVTVELHAVDAVVTTGDRARGVRLHDGRRIDAGAVVLAAGAWSARIDGLPPEAVPPVRPVKGQIIRLRGPARDPVLRTCIRGLVRGTHLYCVPRADGRIVVGATQEEMGFDTSVTAEGIHTLLRDTVDLCPGLADLELIETSAGLRPGTPDNGPVVGAGGLNGLIVATGHFRHGILLTPITAEAVVALVGGEALPDELVPFGPGRFALDVVP
jgi:glycine oxidase